MSAPLKERQRSREKRGRHDKDVYFAHPLLKSWNRLTNLDKGKLGLRTDG